MVTLNHGQRRLSVVRAEAPQRIATLIGLAHLAGHGGGGANFLGDVFGLIGVEIHRNFGRGRFDEQADHAAVGWADLQVRFGVGFVVYTHGCGVDRGTEPCNGRAMLEDIEFRDLEPGDAGWVASRHGALYWTDEGYDLRFEAFVMRILADFIETRGDGERAWIAHRGETRLGCIFCTRPEPEVAKLRMFLVEPDMRGTGLAQALLGRVMEFARQAGAKRLVLWTHESHRAAGRLYRRSGFTLLSQKPVEAFGQPTMEQNWEIAL